MKLCKLLLAALCAATVLAVLAGAASARSFSFEGLTWQATFREVRFNGVFGNITCQVTLQGSLHARTLSKTPASLIGYITRADLGPCAEGRATLLRETLPWHTRYASFAGTLPSITTIRVTITGLGFRIQEPFAGCLARATAEAPANGTLNRNTVTRTIDTAEIGGTIPTSCGVEGSLSSNRAPFTVLNSTARLTVTLI